MGLANYGQLKTAVAEWLNRTDLTLIIPDLVSLAEADIRADLMSRNVTRDAALVIDAAEITLSADIKYPRSLYIEDSLVGGPIHIRPPEHVAEHRRRYPTAGAPRVAAFVNGTLIVSPTPDASYTATIIFEPQVAALTLDGDTNWLLEDHPNVYLYGSLKHAAPLLRDDERVQIWQSLYLDQIGKMEDARDRYEYGAGPLIALPRYPYGG